MDWILYANLGLAAVAALGVICLFALKGRDEATPRLLDSLDRLERRLRDEIAASPRLA